MTLSLLSSLLLAADAAALPSSPNEPGRRLPDDSAAPRTVSAPAPPRVRDEQPVVVNGKSEVWQLQWLTVPVQVCAPDDIGWPACPCMGFEFGEAGDLALIRLEAGREVERLHLTPFFSDQETPAETPNQAVLQRWPVSEAKDGMAWEDEQDTGFVHLKGLVEKRKPVTILEFADINRDGWATEFVLQVGVLPCGKKQSILMGISPERPHLHAFGTGEHPDVPLILRLDYWGMLRVSESPIRVLSSPCGDHGSDEQEELTLSVEKGAIHVVAETYSCKNQFERGELLSRVIR